MQRTAAASGRIYGRSGVSATQRGRPGCPSQPSLILSMSCAAFTASSTRGAFAVPAVPACASAKIQGTRRCSLKAHRRSSARAASDDIVFSQLLPPPLRNEDDFSWSLAPALVTANDAAQRRRSVCLCYYRGKDAGMVEIGARRGKSSLHKVTTFSSCRPSSRNHRPHSSPASSASTK